MTIGSILEFIGAHPSGFSIHAVRFQPGCLKSIAWGAEVFDCFLIDHVDDREGPDLDSVAREVVEADADFVQIAGTRAEKLLDAIDEAAVRCGRQKERGEGTPRLAWHKHLQTLEQMAARAVASCGQEFQLVLVVGDEELFGEAVDLLKSALARALAGFHHEDTKTPRNAKEK